MIKAEVVVYYPTAKVQPSVVSIFSV